MTEAFFVATPYNGQAPHVLREQDRHASAICGRSYGPKSAFNGWAEVEPMSESNMEGICPPCCFKHAQEARSHA